MIFICIDCLYTMIPQIIQYSIILFLNILYIHSPQSSNSITYINYKHYLQFLNLLLHIAFHYVIEYVYLHLIDGLMVFLDSLQVQEVCCKDCRILCLKEVDMDLIFVLIIILFILLYLNSLSLVLPSYFHYLLWIFVEILQAYRVRLFVALFFELIVYEEPLSTQIDLHLIKQCFHVLEMIFYFLSKAIFHHF